ncbi:MAG: hypothetical protein NDI77_03075, partial [Geobacteraceae bacterium]|nr:hypothetical protein [Geobacteraceae bacterium]
KPLKVEELSSHPAVGADVKAEEKPAEVAAMASSAVAEVKTGQEPLSSPPPASPKTGSQRQAPRAMPALHPFTRGKS